MFSSGYVLRLKANRLTVKCFQRSYNLAHKLRPALGYESERAHTSHEVDTADVRRPVELHHKIKHSPEITVVQNTVLQENFLLISH